MSSSATVTMDQEDVAIDAARTFVGPNASFYDESWRVMLWRGKKTSWNPHAAVYGPFWFAYRRMYLPSLFWLALLQLFWHVYALDWPSWFLAVLLAGCMTASGLFANALYLDHFSRWAKRARHASESVLEQEKLLRRAGGVSRLAVFVFSILVVGQLLFNLLGSLDEPVSWLCEIYIRLPLNLG